MYILFNVMSKQGSRGALLSKSDFFRQDLECNPRFIRNNHENNTVHVLIIIFYNSKYKGRFISNMQHTAYKNIYI